MSSESASPPINSVSEKLLLAQAVCQLGTGDWTAVSSLLTDSKRFPPAKKVKLTSEICSSVFDELISEDNYDIDKAALPNARPTRKIVRKLYSKNLKDVYTAVQASFSEEARLRRKIQDITSGSLDDQILASLPADIRLKIASGTASAAEDIEMAETSHDDNVLPDSEDAGEGQGDEAETETETATAKTRRGGRRPKQEEEIDESLLPDNNEAEIEVKDEETEDTQPQRKGRGRGRRSAKERLAADEGEDSGREEADETPKAGEGGEDEEGEDAEVEEEEDTTGGRKRGGRGRGRGGSAAPSKGKRTHKRKTSEPASPGPSEGRQAKRPRTEDEQAAESARFRKAMTLMLSQLDDDPSATMFKTAVRRSDAPSYADAIKRPMWLAQVLSRVKRGLTKDHVELMRDVALLCANAVQFNGRHDEVGQKAVELWEKLESMVEEYLSREVE